MPRDTLTDLNDHLFAELERLGDEVLTGEDLQQEIQRAKAIASLGAQIVNAGNLVVKAAKFEEDRLDADKPLPRQLTGGDTGWR